MNKKKNLLLVIAGLALLVLGGGILLLNQGLILARTDQDHYQANHPLKVRVGNYSLKNLCFSSCYPYYLESQQANWFSYHYEDCDRAHKIEKCVGALQVKAFETTLPEVEAGTHRLAIPICVGCKIGEGFQSTRWFYSNQFEITP